MLAHPPLLDQPSQCDQRKLWNQRTLWNQRKLWTPINRLSPSHPSSKSSTLDLASKITGLNLSSHSQKTKRYAAPSVYLHS